MKLFGAAAMRDLDRVAIEQVGIPGVVLMEIAGRGAAETPRDRGARTVLVLAGPGNNGGDGLVVARHLADRGLHVTVALLARADAMKGDAATMLGMLPHFAVRVIQVPDGLPDDLPAELAGTGPDVVVDAIFGTGLARPVEGVFADAVDAANALPCPRVALDLPTGIDADTGRVLGRAVRADLTVTFGAAKVGHWSYPGRAYRGRLEVVPIGIPRAAIDAAEGALLVGPHEAAAAFPPRDADAFKNAFGHVLVVGGLPGKAGAALLAAMGAVRAGAGLVSVATHPDSAARVEGRHPELMVEAAIGTADAAALAAMLLRASAVVAGPGLGTGDGSAAALRRAIDAGLPCVLDADALNCVAAAPDAGWSLRPDVVLTPHPGEAARLLGRTGRDVQADRVTAAGDLAARFGSVAVLKGAGTVVAAPDGRLAVNPTGGPALATAGSGDVLSGILGALLGRGVPAFEAACAAAWLHGAAGDLAADRLTEHGVGASDLCDAIPGAISSALRAVTGGGN
ncbi:MAG: NAD(P)H-hydrate dehydratase [Deltaproteobacteria bacterium]|nr:NAD(P)H-hydrate dehydratase [Deltaproteobacteria bacterium]